MLLNPSVENPTYTVYITTKDKRYDVTPAVMSIDFSEQETQMAVSANLTIADIDYSGKPLSSVFDSRNRVVIYANDGTKNDEVFRGFVWDLSPKESLTENSFTIKAYDHLIYLQESEDHEFFRSGEMTSNIFQSICKKWGIDGRFAYDSIVHKQLVMRGAIADFLTEDLLNEAQRYCSTKYVVRSEKDALWVLKVGSNEMIYTLDAKCNATELRKHKTMNGITTQVIVLGNEDDDGKSPVEATLSKNTDEYGTLQKIISRSEDTTLYDATKEARSILNEDGKPKWEYDIKAVDIPWIRKGDKVLVHTKSLNGTYIVKSIDREISNRGNHMTLTIASP